MSLSYQEDFTTAGFDREVVNPVTAKAGDCLATGVYLAMTNGPAIVKVGMSVFGSAGGWGECDGLVVRGVPDPVAVLVVGAIHEFRDYPLIITSFVIIPRME